MIFIAIVASHFRPFNQGFEINSNVSHNTVESKPLFEPQNSSQWEYPYSPPRLVAFAWDLSLSFQHLTAWRVTPPINLHNRPSYICPSAFYSRLPEVD